MAPRLDDVLFWKGHGFGDGVAILDGGLATELERRGANLRDSLWSARVLIDDPDLIRQVHCDYVAAGAQIITTATYQASFEGFARHGIDQTQTTALMQKAVALARSAQARLVAASIGPYGAYLADGSEFRGDYGLTEKQLRDWHRPRLAVIADSGADLIAFETIPCRVEAEALVRLLEEFPEVRAWFSFSCKDRSHLCHGERLDDVVTVVCQSPSAVAVGVNCTAPGLIIDLLMTAAETTTLPLLAYPNLGGVWNETERSWAGGEDFDWLAAASQWHRAGARILGGCCRTTPATIRALAGLER